MFSHFQKVVKLDVDEYTDTNRERDMLCMHICTDVCVDILIVYTNICMCYFSESFDCNLKTLCSFISKFVSVHYVFPKFKDIVLQQSYWYNTIFNPWSVFNYSNNNLYNSFSPRLESHPRLCIALGCPVFLVPFNLDTSSFMNVMF